MKITFSRLPFVIQFVLLLVSVIPAIWLFIAYDLNRLWTLTDTGNRKQAENLVHVFSEQVNASIHAIDYALIDLREQWNEDPLGLAAVVRRRQQYLEKDVGFQVAILDERGILEFSSADPEARGGAFHDREHFRVHQASPKDELFISQPLLGRVSKRWTIQFTRPIFDQNGGFKGVIVLSVAPEHFSSQHRNFDLGENSSILMIRRTGEILARSPEPAIALGKSLSAQALSDIQQKQSGLYEGSFGFDQVRRLYAWRHTAKGPLVVFVGLSKETLSAAYRAQRRIYLGSGVLLSLLWSVVAYSLLSAYRRRRLHETALRESIDRLADEQQRMQVILENSHDAFVAVDPQGRLTDWNTQAERTFGWSRSDVIGKNMGELIVPDELKDAHHAGFARFVENGQSTSISKVIEVEALHRSGRRIPVELAIAGYRHQGGPAVTAFIRDISLRKAAQREEAERLRALEEARKALQHAQKLEAVGKLTGGVAHDFNNVLQVIGGNLQLLQMLMQENEPLKARVESALQAVDRGAKLSSQLLAFARRQPLKPVVTDLQNILAGMSDLIQRAVGEGIAIRTILPTQHWSCCVDPSQLENVILNLVLNARDAMSGQGAITITLDTITLSARDSSGHADLPDGQYLLLVVSDTGAGMTAEVREQAFEPFFSTKPAGEGTGLGLSMAYGFVKQSGGHIELDSEPGQGTDVRIFLPRSLDVPVQAAPRYEPEGMTGGEETIIVAEDDHDVRTTAVAILRELGYRVHEASDGEGALRLMRSLPKVDVLFTDVIMPGAVRGVELARQAQEIAPDIIVLFTSGYTENALGKEGMLDSSIHLLNKPYRHEQLASMIRSLLRHKAVRQT